MEVTDVHWETRFAAIENNHLQLQKDVSSLARDLSALTQAVKGITVAAKTLSETQASILAPKWGAIISGFGVVMLVAGLVLFEPLNKLAEYHRIHVKDGHPQSVLDKILADEKKLEERLNRKQLQLAMVEIRLDEQAEMQAQAGERLQSVEREVFKGTLYRSGRPERQLERAK